MSVVLDGERAEDAEARGLAAAVPSAHTSSHEARGVREALQLAFRDRAEAVAAAVPEAARTRSLHST